MPAAAPVSKTAALFSGAIRDFRPEDAAAVNALAVAAFEQYAPHYTDWPALSRRLEDMASLAQHGELIVAESGGRIVGAVAYIGPGQAKSAFFEPQWSVMRMLVVSPAARGMGLGRLLAGQCVNRAVRDQAGAIALHTAGSLMRVALPMYERMGFRFLRDTPPIAGVAYAVHIKLLGPPAAAALSKAAAAT